MKNIAILATPECNDIFPALLSKKVFSLYLSKQNKFVDKVLFIKSSYIWRHDFWKKNYVNENDCVTYTNDLKNKEDLKQLNENNDVFILGPENILDNQQAIFQHFLFDFVKENKVKGAYALSLNSKYDFYGTYRQLLSKFLLGRFNKISVKDKQSQELLATIGIKSEIVLDPIFLLDREDFKVDTIKENPYYKSKTFYYILDTSLLSALNCENCNYRTIENKTTFSEFLWSIENSSSVVTDSYCVLYLAILFKRSFVFTVKENSNRELRVLPFLELLDIDKTNIYYIKENEKVSLDKLEANTITLSEKQNNLVNSYIEKSKDFLNSLAKERGNDSYIKDHKDPVLKEIENLFSKEQFKETKAVAKSNKVGILTLSYCTFYNYGNVLVSYALQSTIEKLGYEAGIVAYSPFSLIDEYMKPRSIKDKKFYKINCNLLKYDYKKDEESYDVYFKRVNKDFDTFILCSDVLWLPSFNGFANHYYYLSFVDNNNKKLSYSPSTAASIEKFNTEELKIINLISGLYLHRFANIGVRENSGVSIVKEISGLDANWLLDPVFLLTKEEWTKFINSHEHWDKKEKIFCYTTRNIQIENLTNIGTNDISVFDWVYSIINAQIVVSTSFHATCFAIIFNKPFVLLAEKNVINNEKLKSLFSLFDLPYNKILIVNSYNSVTKEIVLNNVINNYQDKANEVLGTWREKSLNYLANALEKNNGNSLNSASYNATLDKLLKEFSEYLDWMQQ